MSNTSLLSLLRKRWRRKKTQSAARAAAGTAAEGSPSSGASSSSAAGKRTRRGRLRIVLATGAAVLIASLATAGAAAVWVRGLDIGKLEHPLPEPTLIMDRDGRPASQLSSSRIDPVPLEQIPADLRNAVIAVEDRRFYEHAGIDLWSTARALLRDLKSGELKEGGSTLTQQLAKNLFLQSDKTLSRKLKEAGYALKINATYSKDEILELYLNSVYFGEGRWGVEGAAEEYFAKPAQQLTLEESALIAALPKAPSVYSPLQHMDKALERRNLVLSLMKEQHFISDAAYDQAVSKPIVLKQRNEEESLKGKYPSYVDYVIQEAADLYGFTEEQILTAGLRIYTELDPKVQQAAQDVYSDDALFPESQPDQLIQSGTVLLDQTTGGIRALVGARGTQVYRGFNHATQLKRQPGSSFKPLVVYGPALERGYKPSSPLYDGELDIAGYRPRDWDGQTRGQVTLREAIMRSWNIPAVWLLNEIGIDAGVDFARRSGIELGAADRSLSIALGGLSEGVSPLEMAQAFGAIANLGVRQQAHAIVKVTTKEGLPLVEAKAQPAQVTTPAVAYTLTLLLQDAVKSGTGQAAKLERPIAGKTGTTQLPGTAEFADIGANGIKDAWFVGYTPELTAAVWIGYDQTDKNHYLTTGGAAPAGLFKEIMSRALQGAPSAPFTVPPDYEPEPELEPQSEPKSGPQPNVRSSWEQTLREKLGLGKREAKDTPGNSRGSSKGKNKPKEH
ncbi:PBP1A family penicillin-binding protein [Paenibacillus doosanensis]|uniref:transglycosylase domain-containing protein n=1 Tax=Paenibacillus doosanensis TaxID=1229154 RepID=UPI00217F814D|nr:PBP1A family penicillin-binding protein [Paenibacillus doosanensis]MCS7459530.1 PBP1A family penicillin-binding protein [Paenibacillus doosanensis]